MIVRRRTWLYRMAGQPFARVISFERPVTASIVRDALRRTVGIPLELWGRNNTDLLSLHK
ncbi:MAG: hypothetical protein IPL03_02035 [Sterolibacteriaceae bacterium]|jgi:hypothetical protein|nr:hypothetical protein [Candidatus Methylophosphatis haderslevensis]